MTGGTDRWSRLVIQGGVPCLTHRVAVIVRLGALGMVAAAIPFVWNKYPDPLAALALAGGLAVATGVVLALWRRTRTVRRIGLAVDVPVGLAALLLGAAIAPVTDQGWSFYAFPYTILVSITVGMACRTMISAVLLGLTWSMGYTLAVAVFHHVDPVTTIGVLPAYLANVMIGWVSTRIIRRVDTDLEEARRHESAAAAQLAAERERLRHVRALHDRVLQTLETLAASDLITDGDDRERVREHAVWLRRFIRTGAVEVGDDLAAGLAAAAESARRAGLAVDVRDAVLSAPDRRFRLDGRRRTALARATGQLLVALAGHNEAAVVHVDVEQAGVLVTILVTSGTTLPDPADLARASELLAEERGDLRVEPVPYLELRVPFQA